MNGIVILHFAYLGLLLPAALFAAFCCWRSKGEKKPATLVAQLLVGTTIILGFSGIFRQTLVELSKPPSMVTISDRSDSMRAQDPLRDVSAASAFTFASDAKRVASDGSRDVAPSDRSNIGAGVSLAAAQGASASLLATDGVANRGNLLAAAKGLDHPLYVLEPNVPVDVRIIRAFAAPVQPHRAFTIVTEVESSVDITAVVNCTVGSSPQSKQVNLTAGEMQTVAFEFAAGGQSSQVVHVEIEAPGDVQLTNNRFTTTWLASSRARVLLLHEDPAAVAGIVDSLAESGWRPEVLSPGAITAERLESAAAVVLFQTLPAAQQELLGQFAASGGGVVVVGGADVYGAEVLASSKWQEWLPVEPTEAKEETRPESFAMVLIIDKSDSMLQNNRMEMAKQAAKRTVELLNPADQVGILAFGTNADWVSELAPAGDKRELLARISQLKVEGETNLYPAIERAQLALEQIDAEHRHLILLTDGISSPGNFAEAAQSLRVEGVSVATVSVGSGAEQVMLKDIARLSAGSHYHCETADELPNILVRATRQATQAIGPAQFSVFTLEGGLANVDFSSAPTVTGVVATKPKADTSLAYLTDDGQPLIVWREHGGGAAASIICDPKSLLTEPWRKWVGNGRFWEQLCRRMESEPTEDPISVTANIRDDELVVECDVREESGWANGAEVRMRMRAMDGEALKPSEYACYPIAPGRYQAKIELSNRDVESSFAGNVVIVFPDGRTAERPWAANVNYGVEYESVSPNRPLLAAAATASGGKMLASPTEVPMTEFKPTKTVEPVQYPVWYWLAAAAIVLLLLETFVRRWSLRFGVISTG